MEFTMLDIQPSESCRVCGPKPAGPPQKVADKHFEETCARDGRRTFILSPKERVDIDIERLKEVIKKQRLKIKKERQLAELQLWLNQTLPLYENNEKEITRIKRQYEKEKRAILAQTTKVIKKEAKIQLAIEKDKYLQGIISANEYANAVNKALEQNGISGKTAE